MTLLCVVSLFSEIGRRDRGPNDTGRTIGMRSGFLLLEHVREPRAQDGAPGRDELKIPLFLDFLKWHNTLEVIRLYPIEPTTGWSVFLNLWPLAGVLWIPPVRYSYRRRRRARRRATGRCAECGYLLAGNISGSCPECGAPARGAWTR